MFKPAQIETATCGKHFSLTIDNERLHRRLIQLIHDGRGSSAESFKIRAELRKACYVAKR